MIYDVSIESISADDGISRMLLLLLHPCYADWFPLLFQWNTINDDKIDTIMVIQRLLVPAALLISQGAW